MTIENGHKHGFCIGFVTFMGTWKKMYVPIILFQPNLTSVRSADSGVPRQLFTFQASELNFISHFTNYFQ